MHCCELGVRQLLLEAMAGEDESLWALGDRLPHCALAGWGIPYALAPVATRAGGT